VVGVVKQEHTRALVYLLEDSNGNRGYVAMAIPNGLVEEDLFVLASTSQGNALAIRSRVFEPYSSPTPGAEPHVVATPRPIDYRQTVGSVELPERHPRTGLVQLLDEDGKLHHEVYLYDERLSAWVRVGTIDIGEDRSAPGRTMTAMVLTPVTLAVDILPVLVLSIFGYDGPYPDIRFPSGSRGPKPVPMRQREAYWESLGPGTLERGRRIPGRQPIPGDWTFELRTDR
jgi:hypothetical protein